MSKIRTTDVKNQNEQHHRCQKSEQERGWVTMEVKQYWARIGLGWEIAWELRVLLVFFKVVAWLISIVEEINTLSPSFFSLSL
jgi:hypothetical protein